jgi:hypothetical protein
MARILDEQLEKPPIFGAEIGVFCGEFSAHMLRHFGCLTMVMVDPWTKFQSVRRTMTQRRVRDWRRYFHTTMANTEFAAERRIVLHASSLKGGSILRPGLLDFCFVDACHRYPTVREDLLEWAGKVRPGGLFAGHDYRREAHRQRLGPWAGLYAAVEEWARFNQYVLHFGEGHVWWVKIPEE